eukprot:11346033-Alexandrium_andersonii.AAC.1
MISEPPERARRDLEQAFGQNPEVSPSHRARTPPRAIQNMTIAVEAGQLDNRTSTGIPSEPATAGVTGLPTGTAAVTSIRTSVSNPAGPASAVASGLPAGATADQALEDAIVRLSRPHAPRDAVLTLDDAIAEPEGPPPALAIADAPEPSPSPAAQGRSPALTPREGSRSRSPAQELETRELRERIQAHEQGLRRAE